MTNRQILIIFLVGAVLTIVGALFKIMHWPAASFLLIIGMTFEAAAGALLVYKISKKDGKNDSFLDS